ncbi:MAG: hypothetical protein QOG03_1181 [Actinomycetota bacterium]|jgi:hypothetical protein|nr:hypothetical protein [Actinomycetota bacterium]
MACPTCGFDDQSVSPADAAVAVRSYDRRFRDLLVRRDDEDRDDSLVRRRGADGWSGLEHTAYVAAALAEVDEALRRILISDSPSVSLPPVDGGAPPSAGDVDSVVGRLTSSTGALAKTIEGASGEDWNRTGSVDGRETTALALARHAVHVGIHHLRAAERVLQEVKGQPAG